MNKCFSFFLFAFGLPPDPWSGHFFYYSSQFCTCWGECSFYLFMPPYQNLHLWILNIDFKYFLWVYLIIGVGFLIYSSDSARGQFSSVQSLSHVQLFATPWITAHQASLSIINSWSSPKLMCIESVMPSSHLIICCPLFLLPPIPPSTRVFSYESAVHMRWPKYWSFSFNISPSNEYPGLISFRMDWLVSLQSKGLSKVFSNTTVRKMVTITLYTRQQKRHWCIEQSFGLCGRGRGWDDLG